MTARNICQSRATFKHVIPSLYPTFHPQVVFKPGLDAGCILHNRHHTRATGINPSCPIFNPLIFNLSVSYNSLHFPARQSTLQVIGLGNVCLRPYLGEACIKLHLYHAQAIQIPLFATLHMVDEGSLVYPPLLAQPGFATLPYVLTYNFPTIHTLTSPSLTQMTQNFCCMFGPT